MANSGGGRWFSGMSRPFLPRQLETYIYAAASGDTSRSFATFELGRAVWPAGGVADPRPEMGIE